MICFWVRRQVIFCHLIHSCFSGVLLFVAGKPTHTVTACINLNHISRRILTAYMGPIRVKPGIDDLNTLHRKDTAVGSNFCRVIRFGISFESCVPCLFWLLVPLKIHCICSVTWGTLWWGYQVVVASAETTELPKHGDSQFALCSADFGCSRIPSIRALHKPSLKVF